VLTFIAGDRPSEVALAVRYGHVQCLVCVTVTRDEEEVNGPKFNYNTGTARLATNIQGAQSRKFQGERENCQAVHART